MEILFVGVACTEDAISESNRKYYCNKSQVRPQQYFDFNLVSGLSEECRVTAVSLPPVASFPKSKCLFYRRKVDKVSENLCIRYIPLLNLPIIKNVIIMLYVAIAAILFCLHTYKKEAAILMGYISSDTSIPAMITSRLLRKKIYAVVPDLPQFINTYTRSSGLARNILKYISTNVEMYIQSKFHGYIFLTEEMNLLINKHNKPYMVIEGMIRKKDFKNTEKIQKHSVRFIMYAGTLHVKFGIKNLVEAFILANLVNCQLWIYGNGDFTGELEKIQFKNSNVKYKGTISRKKLLEIEQKAALLVNPRPSSEEFTKYSFPSKTIEYMASGVPLLTTKLPGIPKEYFNYIFTFKSENAEDMANDLFNIMSMSAAELKSVGESARAFVLEHKNHIEQSKKIFNFLTQNSRGERN